VRQLADEGLVTAEHGRGVFVRTKPRLMRFGAERYSLRLREETAGLPPFAAEAVKQGRTPTWRRRRSPGSSRRRTSPSGSGSTPRTVPSSCWENWYYADGEPVQVGVTYAPWSVVEGSPVADSPQLDDAGGIYVYFERTGHTVRRVREEITARMPTPEEAHGLAVPDGVPVLVVLHTGIDQDGLPFEVTRFVMRADTGGLDYAMAVDE
jgi:GntR family transcriptional regulator